VKILVANKKNAEHISRIMKESHAMISITTPGDDLADLADNDNRVDLLRIQFHDLTDIHVKEAEKGGVPKHMVFPNVGHANQILDWFENLDQSKTDCLIIHCNEGCSRSPGVAAALCEVNGEGEGHFAHDDPRGCYSPNILIKSLIIEEARKRA